MNTGVERLFVSPAPARKRKRRRKGRSFKPFFGFKIMDFYGKGYSAMAKCLGMTRRQLFDYSLRVWAEGAEQILGFGACQAARLSRKEIASIAARIEMAHRASWHGGNKENN